MSVETIAIVHHTHIDFGYTDHQQTCFRMHEKYIEDAICAIERTKDYPADSQFRWTQEVSLPLERWWRAANSRKRARLIEVIRSKHFEVCALPVNVTNFPDEREWEYMLSSMPREIADAAHPTAIMQNDINGISRRGMQMAYDRGVRSLWMGPNSYYGMPPSPAPLPFFWELGDGKRLFVWCNSSYNDGMFLFNDNWRQGPVPAAYDLRYRSPSAGDIFAWNDENLKKSHAILTEKLSALTGGGVIAGTDGFTKCRTRSDYPYKTFITSITGQWRCDNDPPFPYLSDFVRAWNEKGLKPRLCLTTLSQAFEMLRTEIDDSDIPSEKGIWSDYWANGLATSPPEIRCAREARRILSSAHMPMLGAFSRSQKKDEREVLYNLMMYGEHSFASWDSASDPFGQNTVGELVEKDAFAYRALEGARFLLAERVRAKINPSFGTVTLINPTNRLRVERLDLPTNSLRGEYSSLIDPRNGNYIALEKRPGRGNFMRPETEADFSEDNVSRTFGDVCSGMNTVSDAIVLAPYESVTMTLSAKHTDMRKYDVLPLTRLDEKGWPIYVTFEDFDIPLINGKAGDFCAVRAEGVSPRWVFKDVFDADDYATRQSLYNEFFRREDSVYGVCERSEDRGLVIFTQPFTHSSLRRGRRTLVIDCVTRRARLTVKLDRQYDFTPEIFYIGFTAGIDGLPAASLTGEEFVPFRDNIKGTNRDFFAIDGCLRYGEKNSWTWFAEDSVLVCIGEPRPSTRAEMPENTVEFHAQVYDNTWDTNFKPNFCGAMEFRFDISVNPNDCGADCFEAYATPCITVVNTKDQKNI